MHGKVKYTKKQKYVYVHWKDQKKSREVGKIKKSSKFGGLEGQAISGTGMDSEKNGWEEKHVLPQGLRVIKLKDCHCKIILPQRLKVTRLEGFEEKQVLP